MRHNKEGLLEAKLKRMCSFADRESQRTQKSKTRELAKLISAVLKTESWPDLAIKHQRALDDYASDAMYAAKTSDAAQFIYERVLESSNGKVIDLPMKKDLKALQESIFNLFEEDRSLQRGFVYVAWSAKPEKFWYVGKANDAKRLRLSQHGNLARASANATQLSLLYPSKSIEQNLFALEASVIWLIGNRTGKIPELNTKDGQNFPAGTSRKTLRELSGFLKSVANRLE